MSSTGAFIVGQALPLALTLGVFYVFAIRPSRVEEGQRYRAVVGLKGGEAVVTSSGLRGKVIRAQPGLDVFEVEVAEGVVINVTQAGIAKVTSVEGAATLPDAQDACRRLASEWLIPTRVANIVPWTEEAETVIAVLHRPGREKQAARAPKRFDGYRVIVAPAPSPHLVNLGPASAEAGEEGEVNAAQDRVP